MNPYIIITTPHSFCDEHIKERNCDRVAGVAGRYLYENLEGYNRILLPSNIHRSISDLNREPAKTGSYWREELMPTIEVFVTPIFHFYILLFHL